MTTTTNRLPVGQRVMYLGGGTENNEALKGHFGTIIDDDGSSVIPLRVEFDNADFSRWWCDSSQLLPIPKVGDTVIAVRVPMVSKFDGQPCKVTLIEPDSSKTRVLLHGEFTSPQKPDDTESWAFHDWAPVPDASNEADQPGDSPEVTELRFQLARANERVEELRDRASKWERDFNRSWERISREAVERSWCSEYEEVVDDLNPDMEIGVIPARVKRVRRRRRVEATVYRDVWVWVPEDDQYTTDPDDFYENEHDTDSIGDGDMDGSWATDIATSEFENQGFDTIEIKSLD